MVKDFFPGAKPISELITFFESELPKEDLDKTNTLWATSICSDEVNQSLHELDSYFESFGPFIMGGISGIPFAGITGFKAFLSHIPDHGGAAVIYGPHIGITNDGIVGKVNRGGQGCSSTCCGSLVEGLHHVKMENVLTISHDDYQQGQVNKMLIEHYDEIQEADNDILVTTHITYQQIKKELTDIISSSLEDRPHLPLLLVGGILINTDCGQPDMFEIRDVSWFKNKTDE